MKRLPQLIMLTLMGLALTWLDPTGVVRADGTEQLGPASLTLATGTGVVAGGVGLEGAQPQTINLTVPPDATVKQVLLYWSGGGIGVDNAGDPTITVNGASVTGALIGGPTFFFSRQGNPYFFSTYRADITDLGMVGPGANALAVGGLDFGADENNGAGILAMFDDGSAPSEIALRDGMDVAFGDFPGARGVTAPQTFAFAPAPFHRMAQLPMFFGSVALNHDDALFRPTVVEVTIAGVTQFFRNQLNSNGGAQWDTLDIALFVPAGATSLTVQAFSRDDEASGLLPASYTWLAALLVISPQPHQLPLLGDYVWEDTNRNGLQETGEPPIPNVTVALLDCNTPPATLTTTTTDAQGIYRFGDLQPACYTVQVTPPSGYIVTLPNAGGDDAVDSDADPATNRAGPVTLALDETNLTVDAGLWPVRPGIAVEKQTNGEDADLPTGPEVGYGDVVTWTYAIVNTGNVSLTNVMLTDDREGRVTCPQSQLLPGAGMRCQLTGRATTLGQYANTAVVSSAPTIGPPTPVTATDPSHYLSRSFSLGNRVWLDDGAGIVDDSMIDDGIQNGSEIGIGGVLLNLLDGTGAPVLGPTNQPLTVRSAPDGCYLFDNLQSGEYIVEVAAGNFALGQPLADHLSSGGNSVADFAPNPNTDIDLDDNGNDRAVNGAIRSGIIALGLKREPVGETPCGSGGSALDHNSNLTLDFGFLPRRLALAKLSLGNLVWHDEDNDGLKDANEHGIDGVELQLFRAGQTPGVDAPLATTVTAGGGSYRFSRLEPGDYFVDVPGCGCLPTALSPYPVSSFPTVELDNGVDNDDNGTQSAGSGGTVRSPVINLAEGAEPDTPVDTDGTNSDLTVDFGYFEMVRVGDFVWFDDNHNGLHDADEASVPDVTVRIFTAAGQPATDVNGAPVPPQTTDKEGIYLFTPLPPGSYYVVFDRTTLPRGYAITTPKVGSDDAIDSDADPSTGRTGVTPFLPSGTVDFTLDLGVYQLPTVRVGGYVRADQNRNGLPDTGEPGVPNVTAALFAANSVAQLAVTETDASGSYRFAALAPGQYYVVFDLATLPPGYQVRTQTASGVGGEAYSDADPAGGRSSNSRILASGEEDLTLDLGVFAPTAVDPADEPGQTDKTVFLPMVSR